MKLSNILTEATKELDFNDLEKTADSLVKKYFGNTMTKSVSKLGSQEVVYRYEEKDGKKSISFNYTNGRSNTLKITCSMDSYKEFGKVRDEIPKLLGNWKITKSGSYGVTFRPY